MQKRKQRLAEATEAELAQQATLSLAVYLPLELLQAGLARARWSPSAGGGAV